MTVKGFFYSTPISIQILTTTEPSHIINNSSVGCFAETAEALFEITSTTARKFPNTVIAMMSSFTRRNGINKSTTKKKHSNKAQGGESREKIKEASNSTIETPTQKKNEKFMLALEKAGLLNKVILALDDARSAVSKLLQADGFQRFLKSKVDFGLYPKMVKVGEVNLDCTGMIWAQYAVLHDGISTAKLADLDFFSQFWACPVVKRENKRGPALWKKETKKLHRLGNVPCRIPDVQCLETFPTSGYLPLQQFLDKELSFESMPFIAAVQEIVKHTHAGDISSKGVVKCLTLFVELGKSHIGERNRKAPLEISIPTAQRKALEGLIQSAKFLRTGVSLRRLGAIQRTRDSREEMVKLRNKKGLEELVNAGHSVRGRTTSISDITKKEKKEAKEATKGRSKSMVLPKTQKTKKKSTKAPSGAPVIFFSNPKEEMGPPPSRYRR
jgi:hypothetical protein